MSTRTDTRRAPARGAKPKARTTAPAPPKRAAKGAPRTASAPAARSRTGGGARGRAPRIPFVLFILCLLGATLVSLLVLRSVVAEEAFAITSLQSQNRELSYEEQQLRSTVSQLESSERIAEEAEERGMEEGEAPLFLDHESGEVLGSAGGAE